MNARNLICIIIAGPVLSLSLTGCAVLEPGNGDSAALAPGENVRENVLRPKPRPTSMAPAPSAGARTAEAFDTTSDAERQAATNVSRDVSGERDLGQSIVSLGSPVQPGFWLETSLVTAATPGRVVALATGESVLVELLPMDGPAGAGSRISLAALRLLGVGLTGLHEMQIYER